MKTKQNPADFIEPLHINGMKGRLLHMPAPKGYTQEIMVVYGHHSSLERWWGLAQNLNDYGAVVMPDLPGFGGMQSFFSIGRQATLNDYADYLAAFVKMRYKRRSVTIVGISFGFIVAARMLQRYPELCSKVDFLISAAGFMRSDDFLFSKTRYRFYLTAAKLCRIGPMPWIVRYTLLSEPVLRIAYARTHNAKHKFKQADGDSDTFERMMKREIELWHNNDVRTYLQTTIELLTVDNCGRKVALPVWHVHTPNDNYFDNAIVEQHMRVVFDAYHGVEIATSAHTPSVIANKAEAAAMIPKTLRDMFKKSRSPL
jgi:pimeloyl-ACP methyl ester carboxylesterase